MNYPTATNPLILRYRGHIPAMKNQKVFIRDDDGKNKMVSSQEVKQFFLRCKSMLPQVEKQGFTCMAFPQPVAAYVEIGFYTNNIHGMAASDGDNAYTTLCETWQHPQRAKGDGPILGVIENDRQVLSWQVEVHSVPSRNLEGATAYLWAYNSGMGAWEQRVQFMTAYHQGAFMMATDEDDTLTFEDIDELF